MGEFFKPLRRKIGIVALVLACLFTAGWVRSLTGLDVVNLPMMGNMSPGMVSTDSHILFIVSQITEELDPAVLSLGSSWSRRDFQAIDTLSGRPDDKIYDMRILRIGMNYIETPIARVRQFTAPYWFCVIPLTLLSGWLLLSNPRKQNPKSPEPVEVLGA